MIDTNFNAPKYWMTQVVLRVIALIAKLPSWASVRVGNTIAWLLLNVGKRRRRIAAINIEKCFPELSPAEQKNLLKGNMKAIGRGAVEIAKCWFTSLQHQKEKSKLVGEEHLKAALAKGKGVILLSFHLTSLEIGGCLLGKYFDFIAMYKPNKNLLFNKAMNDGRLKHLHGLIDRNNLRGTIKALKNNQVIWYATDQNYGGKSSVFVPFFGIQTATITSTTKLSKMTGATVVPFTQKRLEADDEYELKLYPALEDFPGANEHEDAARINRFLESYLKENPADYMWLHQRFRNRPTGEQAFY